MKACMLASVFFVAAADDLAITWKDCGAKHSTITDVQPTTIALGAETEITGTGTVDEDVSAGTFDAEVKAGAGIIDQHFTGNVCEAKSFNLPLGIGTLDWEGVACPLQAGTASIKMKVTLASALPASLATSDITLKAQDQNSEDLVCASIHLAKAVDAEQGVNCDGAACPAICDCANDKCSSAIDACLADTTCASAQSCVLACSCGDTACAAGCAAGAGDAATAVLGCLTSSCGGEEPAPFWEQQGVSCDGAACPTICECANDKCSSAIDACLADTTCASAQSCVLACSCGDTACAAGCAAGAGDAATAVLGCLTSSCAGDSVVV